MENQSDNNMGTAILAAIGGVFSSIGSIWSSSNKVKNTRLELQKAEADSKAAADILKQEQLLKALEVKQAAYASAVAEEKANANLRGIVYVIGGGLIGLLAWMFFRQNPDALKLKK